MTSLTTSPVSALTTHPAEVIYGPRPGPSLSPMEVLKILRRRIGWIAAVWLVVSSVTVGGTFLWIKYYPGYRSEAYILVESPQPGAPFEIGATPLHQDLIERFVRDQAVLMKSEQILREALGDPVLRETSWFKSFETPDEALLELRDKLISSPIRGSSYLRVAFTTHNPEDSARIVNAVVDRYWAEVRRRSQERFRDQAGSFSREVDSVKRALDDKVNQIREFQKEAGIPGMTERVTAVAQRLLQATLAVMQAQEQKLEVKAIYESYAALGPDNLPISPDVIAAVELDPRVAGLQNRELGLREELSVQRQKLGDNHQIIKDLQARLQVVQEQLERLRSQRLEDLQRQQVEQARVAYNAAVEKE
ncbi:MAG: GumC family protein, partial [Phycisphaerae bacterium]